VADGRTVRAVALATILAVAGVARADQSCELERWRTGVGVQARDDALAVATVEDGSPAAAGGLRPGDAVVQVNGVVTRNCSDWARAVREARRDRKALLVLVRRSADDVPLAVAAAAWDRTPPTPEVAARAPAAAAPTVDALVAAAPPPMPGASRPALADVVRELGALPGVRGGLPAYVAAVERAHADASGLSRASVPADVVAGVGTVLRYHDAAAVAWRAEEAARERAGGSRRLPSPDSMVAPYFTDSDEETTINAFPFLAGTVARTPGPGLIGEASGLWRPVEARRLLWERARAEQEQLATWLGMPGR